MTKILRSNSGFPLLIHGGTGSPAVLSLTPSRGGAAGNPHIGAKANKEEEEGKKPWIPFGINDDFPKVIAGLMKKTTVGRAGLQRLTKYIYGQRLILFKVQNITDSGKETIELIREQKWLDILGRSNMKMVRLATMQDYTWFALAYVEFIFNGDKSLVHSINYHATSHCRLAPRDPKTGRLTHVYISGNFPDAKEEDCDKLPVIDMVNFYDQIDEIRADKTTFKYIMPLMWPDVLNDYYPVAFWDSVRESGWLDIAISIPAYKKALFKNQVSIKYDIQIPVEYFEFKYKNWNGMTQVEQDEILTALYTEVVASLTGAANAQKALMSFYKTDRNSGKPMGQWIIKMIDDKMSNDAYLPDTTAADFQISYGMGLNPSQSGQGGSGGSYSGGANNGGSNIRESGLDLRAQLKADRDVCLSWFDFVKVYNGMDPELELGVQDMVLTTLDEGKGTEKVVS